MRDEDGVWDVGCGMWDVMRKNYTSSLIHVDDGIATQSLKSIR